MKKIVVILTFIGSSLINTGLAYSADHLANAIKYLKVLSGQAAAYSYDVSHDGKVGLEDVIFSLRQAMETDAYNWQRTLAQDFDIVDTFDQLEDWQAAGVSQHYDVETMPKVSGSSNYYGNEVMNSVYDLGNHNSIWSIYSNDHMLLLYMDKTADFTEKSLLRGTDSGKSGKITFVQDNGDGTGFVTLYKTGLGFQPGEIIYDDKGGSARFTGYPDWIRDHGPEYTWRNQGKSACINYYNFIGAFDGFGPSRLGTFFGDGQSSKSGYKKIHVFFMLKFHPGFFAMQEGGGDSFEYVAVLKFLDILAGFTKSDKWGTDSQRAEAGYQTPNFHEYGLGSSLFNIDGGGASFSKNLYFKDGSSRPIPKTESAKWINGYNRCVSTYLETCSGDVSCEEACRDESNDCYIQYQYGWGLEFIFPNALDSFRLLQDDNPSANPLAEQYLQDKWMGVEYILDIGTLNPDGSGNEDGSTEIFVYDISGNVIGHSNVSGYRRQNHFDQAFNKIVFGGNRFGAGYYEDPGDSNENRFYIDDVIIEGDRGDGKNKRGQVYTGQTIGERYFKILHPDT